MELVRYLGGRLRRGARQISGRRPEASAHSQSVSFFMGGGLTWPVRYPCGPLSWLLTSLGAAYAEAIRHSALRPHVRRGPSPASATTPPPPPLSEDERASAAVTDKNRFVYWGINISKAEAEMAEELIHLHGIRNLNDDVTHEVRSFEGPVPRGFTTTDGLETLSKLSFNNN